MRSETWGRRTDSDELIWYLNVGYQNISCQAPRDSREGLQRHVRRREGALSKRSAAPPSRLPAVVRKGLVGLRHAVDVVLALVGAALLGLRVHQLVGEPLGHRLLAPLAGELDQP